MQKTTSILNELFIYIAIIIALVIFILASFPQFGIVINQSQILVLVIVLVLLLFRHFSDVEPMLVFASVMAFFTLFVLLYTSQ